MKKVFFCLAILVIGLWSCSEDLNVATTEENNQAQFREGYYHNESSQTGVRNVGNWLQFESFRVMDNIEEVLRRDMENHYYYTEGQDSEGEEGAIDDNVILAAWENSLGHRSLRVNLLEREWRMLQEGVRPDKALNLLDDKGIVSDTRQAFVNKDGVVQVGSSIYISKKDKIIEVQNGNADAVRHIIDKGMIAIYDPRIIKDIKLHHFTGGITAAPDCTADFALTSQTETDGNYNTFFTWATNSDLNDLSEVELKWDFGDGSDEVTSSLGTINHTYSEAGSYLVCLEVSWTHVEGEGDEQETTTCSNSTCMEIEIEESTDWGEVLCTTLQGLSFLSVDDINQLLIDENSSTAGQLCLYTTGLLDILAGIALDIEPSDIQFTLVEQGETITGSGCFTITCNSEFQVEVKIGDCTVTFDIDYNGFIDQCDDDDSETDWLWEEYVDEEKAISYKLKTKSKENNFIGGCNCVWAEMHNYEKDGNKWKKKKKNLKLKFSDRVYLDNNCDCDDSEEVNAQKEKKKKCINKEDKVEADVDGISANGADPWHASFWVEGQFIIEASPFD